MTKEDFLQPLINFIKEEAFKTHIPNSLKTQEAHAEQKAQEFEANMRHLEQRIYNGASAILSKLR